MSLLLAHSEPDQIVAYQAGEPIRAHYFLQQVKALAAQMPTGRFVINICSNRLNFAIGFCAAVMSGRTTLMPSTLAPELIEQLRERYPNLLVLWDQNNSLLDLPNYQVSVLCDNLTPSHISYVVPDIDDQHIAAYVFTSGSTGLPQAHPKAWGLLHRNAQAQALRVRETLNSDLEARFTLVGTVPAQHMYGFESTVLLALLTGNSFAAEHPFFTADIATTLSQIVEKKVLVSTPFHLSRVCADLAEKAKSLNPIALVFCATAPLSQVLAGLITSALNAQVLEIYGCTESGQLATRNTNETAVWHTYANIVVEARKTALADELQFIVSGGHVPGQIALSDVLLLHDATHFELLGRDADMINVAGKRQSLANLTHHLCSIKGVIDGVYFLPDETGDDISQGNVVRPIAFVVGEGLDAKQVHTALRQKIDAIFLPRRIYFVDKLPRTSTGKLPRLAMVALHQSVS